MSISFTQAVEVRKGQKITSTQMRALARAWRDRDLSGIGDTVWRRAMMLYNGFRQVRNPDESGLVFPSQGEFFEVYQHVTPEMDIQWPETGPGEPEGANVANPVNQFVFGLDEGIEGEADRLGGLNGLPMWVHGHPPVTPSELWDEAAAQRGVIEPETFAQKVPAMEIAQSHFQIVTPYYSPHGKSYGGFFPSPVELATAASDGFSCGDTDSTGLGVNSYQVFFTALRTDVATDGFHGSVGTNGDGFATVTYAGTCPLGTDQTAAGHVVAKVTLPFATYIGVNDGSGGVNVDRFDRTEWIEGPYTGAAQIARDEGHQLDRYVWKFGNDFRGSRAQRADDDKFKIKDIAFDFEAFSTRQYHLAPNIGRFSGDALEAIYPTAQISAAVSGVVTPAGTLGTFLDGGSSSHAYREGFVLTAVLVTGEGLAAAAAVQICDGETILATVDLTPDGSGKAEALKVFEVAKTVNLKVKAAGPSPTVFVDGDGFIEVKATELLEYKPNWWDFYLVLRMSATSGGDSDQAGIDGGGVDYDYSLDVWNNYWETGCIVNGATVGPRDQAEWVNDNPVFDAGRRLTREVFRVVPTRQLVSYEVIDDAGTAKSVLRFYRYVHGVIGIDNATLDAFEGIAPAAAAVVSGELVFGEEYVVRGTSGHGAYSGRPVAIGETFVATSSAEKAKEFKVIGDCLVFVWNGIRQVALPKGWTNEWTMFLQSKVYHPSESSTWKEDAYGRYYTWNNRCQFYGAEIFDTAFRRHITYNSHASVTDNGDGTFSLQVLPEAVQPELIVVESPSGYNYANNSNHAFVTDDFYSSCQIYQPPYLVESATIEIVGGEEIVKLTLAERLQSTGSAPATVDPEPFTWSGGELSDLRAETFRTDDNSVREYMAYTWGLGNASWKTGDAGVNSSVQFQPDNPFGSIMNHFLLVKMLPEPFEDGNDILQSHDTRAVMDWMVHAEICVASGCEGFVDGRTSLDITCATGEGSLYDYQYRNVCFDGFHGAYIGAFPLAVRADDAHGFGPIANTVLYAEVFNRLVKTTNLLTVARVMLPFTIECRTKSFTGMQAVTPLSWPDPGTPYGCGDYPGGGTFYISYAGCPPAANDVAVDWDAWGDCGTSIEANSSSDFFLTGACPPGGAQFWLGTNRNIVEYRVALALGAELAIPASWRDDVAVLGGFVGLFQASASKAIAGTTDVEADAVGCCPNYQDEGTPCAPNFWDGSSGLASWGAQEISSTSECRLVSAGILDPGTPPCGEPFMGGSNGALLPSICTNGSASTRSLTIYTDPGFFITVPLVALA